MEVKLKVRRYDPESGEEPHYQDYTVDMLPTATVLDALIEVREYHDGTLSLRCSCRSAICGSCAMRINGRARLACKTQISGVIDENGEILVEPAGNMPTIKDLVFDLAPFFNKVRAVKPWLQPTGPVPEREYIVPNEAMNALTETMNCIMCGACVSDCTVLEVDKSKGRSEKIRRPVLFGEQGTEDVAFEIDAVHDQLGIVVEVEAGRGARGNAVYRDLIRASLIVDARYLVLGVMHFYRHNSGGRLVSVPSYKDARYLLDAVYGSGRLALPFEGVLLFGY